MLLVCAVTIVAIATEKVHKYFNGPPTAPSSDELAQVNREIPSAPRSTPDPLPALGDAGLSHMSGLLGEGPPAKLGPLGVPQLDWVTSDKIASHTANYNDMLQMSGTLPPPTIVGQLCNWLVTSSGKMGRRYTVRIPQSVPSVS